MARSRLMGSRIRTAMFIEMQTGLASCSQGLIKDMLMGSSRRGLRIILPASFGSDCHGIVRYGTCLAYFHYPSMHSPNLKWSDPDA